MDAAADAVGVPVRGGHRDVQVDMLGGVEREWLASLDGVLDAVLSGDVAGLGATCLLEWRVGLQRVQDRLACAVAGAQRVYDVSGEWAEHGARSGAAWVAYRCGAPRTEARAVARPGRDLAGLDVVHAAFASGRVGACHVRRIGRMYGNHRARDAVVEAQEMLIGWAEGLDWDDFDRALAYFEQAADPDGAEDKAKDGVENRRVHLSPGLDGTGLLDGVLSPLGYQSLRSALERVEKAMFHDDWAEAEQELGHKPALADLARSGPQRMHDALVELAERAMAAPKDAKRPKPLVTVLVGFESFGQAIHQWADGTVTTPGTIATLLNNDPLIERVVFDGPSRVSDVGEARCFTGALRRAIEVRDRTCRWPGCDTPYEQCQVDHTHRAADGGPTTQHNGRLLCRFHNLHRENYRNKHGKEPPETPPA